MLLDFFFFFFFRTQFTARCARLYPYNEKRHGTIWPSQIIGLFVFVCVCLVKSRVVFGYTAVGLDSLLRIKEGTKREREKKKKYCYTLYIFLQRNKRVLDVFIYAHHCLSADGIEEEKTFKQNTHQSTIYKNVYICTVYIEKE